MKKLHTVSIIISIIAIAGFILWRFVVPIPDWFVRVDGVIMLAAVFTIVFSSAKIKLSKN
jgi:hypothetical protein